MNNAQAHAAWRRRNEWLPVGLVLAGVALLHASAVHKPFFADDYLFLEQVRGRTLLEALAAPDPLGNFFRPLGRAGYFWTVTRLIGESPGGFHYINIGLFAGGLLTFFAIARRLTGATTALMATSFVAFHYAADVPLRWASGAQDLLAILFANLAILLHLKGLRASAIVCLLLGLLSKEVVAGAALVAIVGAWTTGERGFVRRHGGLILATLCYGAILAVTFGRRISVAVGAAFAPGDLPAALLHLVQTSLGAEVRLGGDSFGHWGAAALLPATLAGLVCWIGCRTALPPSVPEVSVPAARTRSIRVGLAWSLVGVAPVVAVASIWSAYFYLWSLFGVGLLLAGLSSGLRPIWRTGLLCALVLLSSNARRLDEFAPARGAWSWQSHVNRHYIDRALETIDKHLRELRAARPAFPPRSTVYFANVAVSSGWQTANGPLLRWAYGDSTLRSYYLSQFTREMASRGNLYFFVVEDGVLKDKTEDPEVLLSLAYSMLLAERPRSAIDALELAEGRWPARAEPRYWRAWAHWQLGDSTTAKRILESCGVAAVRSLPLGAKAAFNATAGDSIARLALLHHLRNRAGLSPWVHARLAALLLGSGPNPTGAVEALAFRVLAPDEPDAWRKWASAQMAERQYQPALASLDRYFRLSGESAQLDVEARQAVASIRRMLTGDVAQRSLR